MTKILNHKYENNELSFQVEQNGHKKWLKGKDFKGDHSIITEYWEEYSKKSNDESSSIWSLSQVIIPPPKEILEILNIDDVSHALCNLETFDTPVYVPTRFLRNAYPSVLVKFFEDIILQNPDKYSKE